MFSNQPAAIKAPFLVKHICPRSSAANKAGFLENQQETDPRRLELDPGQ